MIKACVFDIDGTLLNTLKSLSLAQSANMALYGYGEIDEEHTKMFVGDGYKKFIERSLQYVGDMDLEHYEEACKTYPAIFNKHCLDQVRPYEGMVEALKELKKMGIRLGVVSNKPQYGADKNIETFFERGLFQKVYGERPEVPRKPDPTMILEMLKELEVKPEECMYFGDTNTDMLTGQAAKVITIGVTWGFRDREELESFQPDNIIDHPSQIIDLIKKKN